MSDQAVLFDGSGEPDIHYFLFFFENVAQHEETGEKKARSFITYLRGEAYEFHYKTFLVDGTLTEAAKEFENVKHEFIAKYEKKEEMQVLVDRAVNLRIESGEGITGFVDRAERKYQAAKFSDEQKFAFLSKAAIRGEQVRNFVVLHAPKTYKKLQDVLKE